MKVVVVEVVVEAVVRLVVKGIVKLDKIHLSLLYSVLL